MLTDFSDNLLHKDRSLNAFAYIDSKKGRFSFWKSGFIR